MIPGMADQIAHGSWEGFGFDIKPLYWGGLTFTFIIRRLIIKYRRRFYWIAGQYP